jgi:hypothetical protein
MPPESQQPLTEPPNHQNLAPSQPQCTTCLQTQVATPSSHPAMQPKPNPSTPPQCSCAALNNTVRNARVTADGMQAGVACTRTLPWKQAADDTPSWDAHNYDLLPARRPGAPWHVHKQHACCTAGSVQCTPQLYTHAVSTFASTTHNLCAFTQPTATCTNMHLIHSSTGTLSPLQPRHRLVSCWSQTVL